MSKLNDFPPPLEQPLVAHLIELRDRLLRAVLVIVVIFLSLFYFANDLYSLLAEPLLRHMPTGTSMIATEVASPFLTPFKLTLVLSVFIAIPFLLYQLWGFIAPALYQKEKKLVFPLLFSSTILFYVGVCFAYFVVFPLVFGFLTGVVPEGVAVMTDISRYLDFVLKMFFAFGLAFEVPIATILVIWTGLTTADSLRKKRPYIIVGAFVFGMLLTPPDVISQTLLALPMWLLFEVGLIMSVLYTRKQPDEDPDDDDTPSPQPDNKPKTPTTRTEPAGDIQPIDEDSSPGPASHYSEDSHEITEFSDDEMEDEFDRIEAEEEHWDNEDKEQHVEFEPIEEERERNKTGSDDDLDKDKA